MKKQNYYKLFYLVSILALIVFFIRIGVDYFKYDITSSVPFYLFLIERTLEFIVQSIIFFLIGKIKERRIYAIILYFSNNNIFVCNY